MPTAIASNYIIQMEFGSTVYGTSLPTSDKDYKGIYLPMPHDIILGTTREVINKSTKPAGQLKNSEADIDTEIFSLKQYFKLLLEGQPAALTMLFIPPQHIINEPYSFIPEVWSIIQNNRHRFLHKGVSAFAGYCRGQANKYGIKGSRMGTVRVVMEFFRQQPQAIKLREVWPKLEDAFTNMEHCEFLTSSPSTAPEQIVRMFSACNRKVQEHIKVSEALKIYTHLFDEYGHRTLQAQINQNIDWKALMHAVRVAGEALELLTTHTITYPRPDAPLLLDIRQGHLPYQQVADLIEKGLADLETAQLTSTLPDSPDYVWTNGLIYNTYLRHIEVWG